MTQKAINPATGETIQTYPIYSDAKVQRMIEAGHSCFQSWKKTSMDERERLMKKAYEVIISHKEDFATLITLEMGKPLRQSVAEVEKCAQAALYFAQNARAFLADQEVKTEYRKSYVSFQPMGIVLGIMPWNFPFWQVLRYAFPALMGGNVCLLKHASNTPGCALAIVSIFVEAGFPAHAFQAALIPSDSVEKIIADPRVRAVTLTGSTPAGRSVAALAGKYLKKTVLELGGSDPYLILEDCDIEHAIATCVASRIGNCGQSCVSAKRLIVVEKHKAQFEAGMVAGFKKQVQGNPADINTTIGPMARTDLRDELHAQVQKTLAQGATCLLGGEKPDGKGAFYPPTVMSDVRKGMLAYSEEIFGPVAVIIPVADEAEAIRVANDTSFGLGGAVFTKDLERGERIAREEIDSGSCFVNMMVRSDTRLPFGGTKESGYGRELSAFGMHEFVNIKSVVVS